MRKINITPKPYTKSERVFLNRIEENRGKEFFQMKNLDNMVKQKSAEQKESRGVQMNYFTPEYINEWIYNK